MNTTVVDLGSERRVHVVAVGGYAMSAIARYLRELGHSVSGCDVTDNPILHKLRAEGIEVEVGHDPAHVGTHAPLDFVSVATAVPRDLPELAAAHAAGVPVLSRGETMTLIARTRPRVAVVSGTHGKTTTSAMLTHALRVTHRAPSFFLGGTLSDLGTNAHFDPAGEWLVVEGDESDHSFLEFRRDAALVTNIDADHLDRWNDDLGALIAGFEEFVDGAARGAALCIDDPNVAPLARARPASVTYGFAAGAHVRGLHYEVTRNGSEVEVAISGVPVGRLRLALRGRDMAQNALGAVALAGIVGVPPGDAVEALGSFTGVARRFQFRGSHNGADCYDDYAHTSLEVRTTLARAREGGWSRVVAVFQPHRYSRISRHWPDFSDAFDAADVVVVAGLDPAFELPIDGVSSELVVRALRDAGHPAVESRPEWDQLADVPWTVGRPGDCIVTLGCGTITNVHDDWDRVESEAGGRGERRSDHNGATPP